MNIDQRPTTPVPRRTVRVMGDALGVRRYRWAALAATTAYLVVYLIAIRDITVGVGGLRRLLDSPSLDVVPNWTSRMFEQIAPFYFEAVGVYHPTNWIEVLISPMNMVIGLILGLLVGVNVAVAWHLVASAQACNAAGVGSKRAFGGLIGALPAFLGGMACCVPALAIVAGAQFTVFLTAVRSWFVPVAVFALIAALILIWNAHRSKSLPDR